MIEKTQKENVASNFGNFIPIHLFTFTTVHTFAADTVIANDFRTLLPVMELYRGDALSQKARLFISTRMLQKINGTDGHSSTYLQYISPNGREYMLAACAGSLLQQSIILGSDFVTNDIFTDNMVAGSLNFVATNTVLGADANLQYRVSVAFGYVYER